MPSMPALHVNNGPEAGKKYELTLPEYILGRHPECTIVIDVGAVSRHHCKVFKEAQSYWVEDLKSRNGTFVNEQQIAAKHRLQEGDQVRVCDVSFTFKGDPKPALAGSAFAPKLDESSFRAVVVDDDTEDSGSSTIMSKLDVRSGRSGVQIAASPEAKLKALIEITQSLGRAVSLDAVLPQVLDSLFRIFVQADRGFIGLVDKPTGKLIPRWTKLRRSDSDETIRVSRTISKHVLESKEAILSADAASDSRFEMSQSIADFRIRSMMCAPLVDSDNNAMGILQIDTMDQRQRFTESDLELLVSAASQASIAIDNAQLHEEAIKQRTMERDLELAREVQRAFLPEKPPKIDGYEFYDYYQAANEVGGDYYDYIDMPEGRVAVIVADVVGHGVAAAMLMAKLSAETRFCLLTEASPAAAITRLNNKMSRLQLDRFVTFVMAVLDPKANTATIVNAGHMAPILRRVNGTMEEPSSEEAGLPLGVMEDTEFEAVQVQLHLGDSMTMYTDGIDEAMDREGVQYTIDRMREMVKNSDGSPRGISEPLLADVRKHLNGKAQDDDMCLVCLRRSGNLPLNVRETAPAQ
jgi:sigma-B regulation protein RsbU (phosphoserine phosphatase)